MCVYVYMYVCVYVCLIVCVCVCVCVCAKFVYPYAICCMFMHLTLRAYAAMQHMHTHQLGLK